MPCSFDFATVPTHPPTIAMNPSMNRRSFLGNYHACWVPVWPTGIGVRRHHARRGQKNQGRPHRLRRARQWRARGFPRSLQDPRRRGRGDRHRRCLQGPASRAPARSYGLAADRCFGGYDAYQKVIATDCDYVLMATPPAFRPVHFAAAVEAGKHCFIEKPVAVDPAGARSIIATGEKAKAKGLAVVTGTQRRHQAAICATRPSSTPVPSARSRAAWSNGTAPCHGSSAATQGESDASYMTRNWLNFTELSGDHIVEQHVHNLDVAVWFLGRLPVGRHRLRRPRTARNGQHVRFLQRRL